MRNLLTRGLLAATLAAVLTLGACSTDTPTGSRSSPDGPAYDSIPKLSPPHGATTQGDSAGKGPGTIGGGT